MNWFKVVSTLPCLIAWMATPTLAQTPAAASAPASVTSPQTGFQRITMPDGTEVGIWYPASGTPIHQKLGLYAQDAVVGAGAPTGSHPLVVMSHGNGGDFTGNLDTSIALARAGFIVAALTHPGDNWRDKSRALRIELRAPALSALITYMLADWSGHAAINPKRIGAFGFSSGGFTVLTAAGGRPDLSRFSDHCMQHPKFYDCTILGTQGHGGAAPWPEMRDPRIKAIVVVAPALGFTLDRNGLGRVRIPVQLWRADNDHILPAPFYADMVRANLPTRAEFHSVPNADHFDFLAPCSDATIAPQLCQSAPDFDRTAFHMHFNGEVVRFLSRALGLCAQVSRKTKTLPSSR